MKRLKYVAGIALCCVTFSASATPILDFFIDGDTFQEGFSITNGSDAGELVTRFQLDISPTDTCFDTVLGGNGVSPCEFADGNAPRAFTPTGGTDIITGLAGPVVVADGATLLDLSFSTFNPFTTFTWDIDVDFNDGTFTVLGSDLIGALATVDFSNGQRLLGILAAVDGNDDASAFTVTGVTQTPPNDIPSPATLALMGLGLAGLGWKHRKKA